MSSAQGKCLFSITLFVLIGLVPYASAQTNRIAFEPTDTLEEIEQKIEANGYDFQVEPNWVFTLSEPEKQRLMSRRAPAKGHKPTEEPDYGPLMNLVQLHNSLPSAFDWRDQDGRSYIGPVRNQGECGSCYSFGAAAAIESVYNINHGLWGDDCVDFSEAFIAFCLGYLSPYNDHFYGCEGSDYDYYELQALVDYGVPEESAFPYSPSLSECNEDSWNASRYSVQSWHRIPCGDINAIKTAIYYYGVVDAAVEVGTAFQAYSTGIYDDSNRSCDANPCYYTPTNHVVALVGWNDNPAEGGEGYWILRNSWSSFWGESGTMRIRYNAAHVACEACYLVPNPMPTATDTPTQTPTHTPTDTPFSTATPTLPPASYAWEFDAIGNFEGWSPNAQLVNTQVADGLLSATSTGNDPWYRTEPELNLDTSNADWLEIRMKATAGNAVQMFFKSPSDLAFTSEKRIALPIASYDVPVIYRATLASIPEWTGIIDRLRFDPTNASGAAIEVDYIRFSGASSVGTMTPTSTPTLTPTPSVSPVTWEFDVRGDFEGWSPNAQLTDLRVANGFLRANSTGNDPWYRTEPGLNLLASDYNRLEIKIKVTAGSVADLFFKSESESVFTSAKRIRLPIVRNDVYITYYVLLSSFPEWTGDIERLRFDPTNESGALTMVDYIRLLP